MRGSPGRECILGLISATTTSPAASYPAQDRTIWCPSCPPDRWCAAGGRVSCLSRADALGLSILRVRFLTSPHGGDFQATSLPARGGRSSIGRALFPWLYLVCSPGAGPIVEGYRPRYILPDGLADDAASPAIHGEYPPRPPARLLPRATEPPERAGDTVAARGVGSAGRSVACGVIPGSGRMVESVDTPGDPFTTTLPSIGPEAGGIVGYQRAQARAGSRRLPSHDAGSVRPTSCAPDDARAGVQYDNTILDGVAQRQSTRSLPRPSTRRPRRAAG